MTAREIVEQFSCEFADGAVEAIEQYAQSRTASLEAEVSELRRDRERLDWVQFSQVRIEPILDMDGKVWNVRTNLGKTVRASVLREAIDAALRNQEEQK